MDLRGTFSLLLAAALFAVPARAQNDMEDLPLLTQDPLMNDAIRSIGKVPLSTNTVGYDPCDDPVADAARKTGCAANGKIEHVVYIVLENRTFDNYYGKLNEGEERVPGIDAAAQENDVPQVFDATARTYPSTRFHLTEYCGFDDPAHGWGAIHRQVNGNKLDGYVQNNGADAPVMGQFEKQDLAYYYNLAKHSAVADRFFASVATSSWPNHYYTVSGTSGGYVNNDLPVIDDDQTRLQPSVDPETGEVKLPETGHVWRTIFDSLEEGGVSWKIYMTNIAIPMAFSNFKKWVATGHVTTIAEYYKDVASGTLPQVAYLAPGVSVSDEHPGTGNHQRGMLQTSTLISALMASPVWGSSVFFVTYDDSGGWYDHVPPPRAYQPNDRCDLSPRADVCANALDAECNCLNGTWLPAAKAGYTPPMPVAERAGDSFDQLAARIPFMIISPWVKNGAGGKGYATHKVYENATTLSFIEWRFGLSSLNDRTAAYKEGWRNPGCDWDAAKLDAAAAVPDTEEALRPRYRALAWSANLFDPFRTVRCEPCPASDPFCAAPNPALNEGLRARVHDLTTDDPTDTKPMTLAFPENRYLDPLLDPFDFSQPAPGLLDGAQLAATLNPAEDLNDGEAVNCPASSEPRLAVVPPSE